MDALVKVDKLTKSFGSSVKAIDDVSFEIQRGEIISILGESGSGKSTLLKTLSGLEDADFGTVDVDGETITGPNHNLVPGYDSIALVDQGYELERFKTVEDNIGSAIYHFDLQERETRVNELLELCMLKDKAESFPHELSGGQQQRVSIAIALAKEPIVVLLDEPFSSLDSRLKSIIREEVIGILKKTGTTVIMVSHDYSDAMAVADRIMIMHKGKMVQSGTSKELYDTPFNEYVANFLGPSNKIKLNGVTKWNIVRPERIKIRRNGNYEGEIVKTVFHGLHYHVFVKSEISRKDVLIYSGKARKVGSKVRFDVD